MGRDGVTLPAAVLCLLMKKRVLVQTHGMISQDKRLVARALDVAATRFVLRNALILSLTPSEDSKLIEVGAPPSALRRLTNTITLEGQPDRRGEVRKIVFLARLHPRKRVDLFIDAARKFADRADSPQFEVYGPDEGDMHLVASAVSSLSNLTYRGAVQMGHAREVFSRADILVLPSEGEVFPMSVLEALASGTLVILARDCEMSPLLSDADAVLLVDRNPKSICDAIEALISDGQLRERLRVNAWHLLQSSLSPEHNFEALERMYSN